MTANRDGAHNSPLSTTVCGLRFLNPVVLAAGTAGYGRELAEVVNLSRIGGLATKAVSAEPRAGAPAPRVTEFRAGMLNAVGLANPGVEAVRTIHLPWLASSCPTLRVLVNVVGNTIGEFASVVRSLDAEPGVDAFELNVSCPNVEAGGVEFGADAAVLTELLSRIRRLTRRPLFVKLSPSLADIARAARTAWDAGADAITLVNTIPGLVVDVQRRRAALGFGGGGVSGGALLPVGVLATWKVRQAVPLPILGIGGVASASDALQYMLAGASLVGVGTAALRDPRAPEGIVRDLGTWCRAEGIARIADIVGTLQWPVTRPVPESIR